MKIEILMSSNFRDYAIKNCMEGIKANKIISELLKNNNISKPKGLKTSLCSIADLKYKNKNIVGASMNIVGGKIFLEI